MFSFLMVTHHHRNCSTRLLLYALAFVVESMCLKETSCGYLSDVFTNNCNTMSQVKQKQRYREG
jgi:hypothetical protein